MLSAHGKLLIQYEHIYTVAENMYLKNFTNPIERIMSSHCFIDMVPVFSQVVSCRSLSPNDNMAPFDAVIMVIGLIGAILGMDLCTQFETIQRTSFF